MSRIIKLLTKKLTRDRSGYVYMMIEESTTWMEIPMHYYKIGSTINPGKRLRDLQTGNPRKLNYVDNCVIPVSDKIAAERRAQERLQEYLVEDYPKGGKEWYKVSASDFESFKYIYITAVEEYMTEPTMEYAIKDSSGYIYMIHEESTGMENYSKYKIGITKNINREETLRYLQRGNPRNLNYVDDCTMYVSDIIAAE